MISNIVLYLIKKTNV